MYIHYIRKKNKLIEVMRRTNKLLRALKGWEFDVKALTETERGSGGVFLSPPKVPRANSPTFLPQRN